MRKLQWNLVPILVVLACAMATSASGQDLFEQYKRSQEHPPLTDEQKAAGQKEPIF